MKAQLAGRKRTRDKTVQKSDDECDDDELIDKLEAQNKRRKEKPVDLDKMTRRQKMAYLAQQEDQNNTT